MGVIQKISQPRKLRAKDTRVNAVFITLDHNMDGAVQAAQAELHQDLPGVNLSVHAATDWHHDQEALARCKKDIAEGDVIVASMIFLENQIDAIKPDLEARRDACDAMMCCMSPNEITKQTRLGKLDMRGEPGGVMGLLKKLKPKSVSAKKAPKGGTPKDAGKKQMAMLKSLPKVLKFVPGTAQDLRAYFLALQYRLAGSSENIANLYRFLINRYSTGERAVLKGAVNVCEPINYPDVGLFHPDHPTRVFDDISELPGPKKPAGTVGLLMLRSYILADDTAHYEGVIRALEAKNLRVIPGFVSALDQRPAIDQYMLAEGGGSNIDALVSLAGFSLVGGPAYNDAKAAEEALAELNVPYVSAHALEFQSLEEWSASSSGLMPVEATIMVAIPELDGATGSVVFGGRTEANKQPGEARKMSAAPQRVSVLADRVANLVSLRTRAKADRKLAVTLFNFPPNSGNTGTAAYLSVFASLFETLKALKADGYEVDLPADVDALREAIINGNREAFGAIANVAATVPTDVHVAREPYLEDIEAAWGSAPGKQQSNGREIFVLGAQFGNVFVGVQPAFGYEGDPMRLLFEKGFAPTHAFSAYYTWLREDFGADAVLHFGTHGALEFMPGKQVGMHESCWPDRLIGSLPNFYLYAGNNPSEGTIAKRRAAATLISYLTPPVTQAGLYKGLVELKGTLDRIRQLPPETPAEDIEGMMELLLAQAEAVDLQPQSDGSAQAMVDWLNRAVHEFETSLIPDGLHVLGQGMGEDDRRAMLRTVSETAFEIELTDAQLDRALRGEQLELGKDKDQIAKAIKIVELNKNLAHNQELDGLLNALNCGFVRPSPSGDLLRTPDLLPTGRNTHGFDPFRIPSAFAVIDGARQAELLIERHRAETGNYPESVALVLWGSDNLKNEGGPIGQALALLGAKPRLDSYGRVSGAELIPLKELARPRIDVLMTLSGIFRDLMPFQIRMLAEASYLAASADEPLDQNYIRAHALAHVEAHGGTIEEASLRVFSNADGAYGANVNNLIDSGAWNDEGEIADTYTNRKSFAFDRNGTVSQQQQLLTENLKTVDLAYQNLDSVELGVTTIDNYFDTLGGISQAAKRAKGGEDIPVYISDQTMGEGKVRTLAEQVALETRTRSLNPKWYEGMLEHGFEGVRNIEAQLNNTFGWSATTGQVSPWVYQQISETFILDEKMRQRLAHFNPTSSARMADKLLEAVDRDFWQPDAATLEALRNASEELEDRLEGILPDGEQGAASA